jgi:hypothetical protein
MRIAPRVMMNGVTRRPVISVPLTRPVAAATAIPPSAAVPVGARGAGGGLARLRHGLVRDAARVHDGDVAARGAVDLDVPVGDQRLAHRLRVGVGDLAAEEADGEGGHGPRP